MFALGQKRTFRNPIGMFDRLRTCRHDCARLSSAQPTEANQVLTPAPRHSDQAQESSGVTHWVCSLAFLPASGFLQGIDYLARHIALIMFGKDRVCGESAVRPEPAFCYYTLPFPEQVGHDALIVHGHISLAVGQGEAHLQIVAALYAAWFHQPADSHARPCRNMLFGEVSRRIKENNRIAESAKHQRDRNGKHTETCPDQNQSSLFTGHLVSFSLRALYHVFNPPELVGIVGKCSFGVRGGGMRLALADRSAPAGRTPLSRNMVNHFQPKRAPDENGSFLSCYGPVHYHGVAPGFRTVAKTR